MVYAEDVIARLTEIMDIYERVPEQRACPARMFVKIMVNLLAEDVPSLRDWASRLAIDIQTGKISLAASTRSDWVGGEASTMIRALLPLRGQAFTSIRSDQGRADGALHLQRSGPSTARPAGSAFTRQAPGRPSTSWPSDANGKAKTKPFGLCSYCDARGCANSNDPKAGKDKCSVFGGCACKPGALADEVRFVDLCRAYLKTTGSKHQSPPYLKGTALRSHIWNHTMDVAQSSFASNSSSPHTRSSPSVVTNLSNPTTGVRVGRENRLRKVGQFRTMAAQFLAQDDVDEAAALNKMADDLEQLDDPEDEAPCYQEPDADECLGAFNKLAVVNRFDYGDFNGAEGLLLGSGSLNTMQGASVKSTVIDVAGAYVLSAIESVYVTVPAGYAQSYDNADPQSVLGPIFVAPVFEKAVYTEPFGHFDLNASDGSDEESPPKFQRFDQSFSASTSTTPASLTRSSWSHQVLVISQCISVAPPRSTPTTTSPPRNMIPGSDTFATNTGRTRASPRMTSRYGASLSAALFGALSTIKTRNRTSCRMTAREPRPS